MVFRNRQEAGERLATTLRRLRGQDVVVLGLPRGGVPVAAVVARELAAPLDVILVRKVGVPFHPELAMGAIGEGGVRVVNEDVVRAARITIEDFARVETGERLELTRRAQRFRGGRPPVSLRDRTAVVIDDGVATGSTASAACHVARALGAARVVFATPVGARQSIAELRQIADEVVCLESPEPFSAVGQWYANFGQTTDEEVTALLRVSDGVQATDVEVMAGPVRLSGALMVPSDPAGLVVFAHGSGSSRNSPRNRWVADWLRDAGFATLLFDLLTPAEQHSRANVFDVELLGRRLADATRWVLREPSVAGLPVGYFGASTGAAAALWAAGEPDLDIAAIVSRGGRPDLATGRLRRVTAPTLLIVGGEDHIVLELNRHAGRDLQNCRVAVVPGATHLFEERGTLRAAAELAGNWFSQHLRPDHTRMRRSG